MGKRERNQLKYVTIYACMIFEIIKTKKMKFYSTVTICNEILTMMKKSNVKNRMSFILSKYIHVGVI